MPTYEYRCPNGHQYETREGFDAPARQPCPTCGAEAKRLLFPPPIVFKGTGFYATDSRHGKSTTVTTDGVFSPAGSSNASAEGNGNGSDAKPAESKPAPAASSSDSE